MEPSAACLNGFLTKSQAAQSRQPCVNSHQLSQWEALGTVIFETPQNRRTLTDR